MVEELDALWLGGGCKTRNGNGWGCGLWIAMECCDLKLQSGARGRKKMMCCFQPAQDCKKHDSVGELV